MPQSPSTFTEMRHTEALHATAETWREAAAPLLLGVCAKVAVATEARNAPSIHRAVVIVSSSRRSTPVTRRRDRGFLVLRGHELQGHSVVAPALARGRGTVL